MIRVRPFETLFLNHSSNFSTVAHWNSQIREAVNDGFPERALVFPLFLQMRLHGTVPDSVTIIGLTQYVTELKDLDLVKGAHAFTVHVGMVNDVSLMNTVISAYGKCADLILAELIFHGLDIESRTIVSWNSLIAGNALFENHHRTFTGEKPDVVTLLSLLSPVRFGQTGSLELRRWVDNCALSYRLRDSVLGCNALIDLYAKCGSVYKAKEVFHSMPSKSIASWTAMIARLALNGEFSEALDFFFRMVELGLKPNHITFLSILQACTHAGCLDKGWGCFDLMTKVYKLNPWLEH
ncbi:hypothetical protein Cgig2_013638 [Carnegiea gigantea]|uniref:Pentatricopeptide repeat-containing protein n=1 Tax=Carnegiea gigantea TaxID=171969 RepID=A0A9Q1KBK8_9CARY|nr:hypothetical protein Cgig2_013638 [Carnegiea gigantea]